jgi:imidazolonepropionase-like amidohydrolase
MRFITGWCATLLAPALLGGATVCTAGTDLAIVNARLYATPDAEAIAGGTLLVHDGKVVALGPAQTIHVPGGATILDAHGGAVTSGFWNCHVHFLTPPLLRPREQGAQQVAAELQAMFTRWGFTNVFDLASLLESTEYIRTQIASGAIAGPRILTVGGPFFPEHGTPIYARDFLKSNGLPSFEVATASEARERARRQLHAGADGVKIFAGAIVGGDIGVLPMPLDIATAAVQEAHHAGKPAFAHPSNAEGIEVAIASGVDVLAHTAPEMGPWDEPLVKRLRAHRMALVPTLTLFEVEIRRGGGNDSVVEREEAIATQQVGAFAAAGGPILFGTDIGYIDVYDTTEEYRLLGRVLTWRQILAALTREPARRFTGQSGALTPGAPADLVVLDADPAADVTAFARVRYTIRGGRVIYRRE